MGLKSESDRKKSRKLTARRTTRENTSGLVEAVAQPDLPIKKGQKHLKTTRRATRGGKSRKAKNPK